MNGDPSRTFVGVDVGGTTVKALLVTGSGRILAETRRPSTRVPAELVSGVTAMAARLASDAAVAPVAVGVVVPGLVDEARGRAVFSANLGWRDIPFRELVGTRLTIPVAFGHDVRAGGLAECRLGAARGHRDVLFLPIGTGISAAITVDGRPYSGRGSAGELGHVVVEPDGDPCGCGGRGCLETVASAAAIARRYSARTGLDAGSARAVLARRREGDPTAAEVWHEAIAGIASVLAACCATLAPELVVLGGGLAEAGDDLTRPLADALSARSTTCRQLTLVRAAFGDRAGAVGAALLAMDLMEQR